VFTFLQRERNLFQKGGENKTSELTCRTLDLKGPANDMRTDLRSYGLIGHGQEMVHQCFFIFMRKKLFNISPAMSNLYQSRVECTFYKIILKQ
jgi:hypothetical protein